MRKKGLLVGALALTSLLPLSSCDSYEYTTAETFQEAYDLFKTFFAKTFEHTNMEVSISSDIDYVADPEKTYEASFERDWKQEESEETETVLGDASHRFDKDGSKDDWAFVNAEGERIAASQKTTHNEDSSITKEQSYRTGRKEYLNAYKSFIDQIDFFEEIASESYLTGKTPEEIGNFDTVEWFSRAEKKTVYEYGKRYHYEAYECWLTLHDEGASLGHTIYRVSGRINGDDGLVDHCFTEYYDCKNDIFRRKEERSFEIKYDTVKKIDLPDVSGWNLEE